MTTSDNNKPEPTAAETYAARRNDIARLLDVLQMELERHDQLTAGDPERWTFAEDLGKVRGDLVNLVGFVSGMDPDEVERFLKVE